MFFHQGKRMFNIHRAQNKLQQKNTQLNCLKEKKKLYKDKSIIVNKYNFEDP